MDKKRLIKVGGGLVLLIGLGIAGWTNLSPNSSIDFALSTEEPFTPEFKSWKRQIEVRKRQPFYVKHYFHDDDGIKEVRLYINDKSDYVKDYEAEIRTGDRHRDMGYPTNMGFPIGDWNKSLGKKLRTGENVLKYELEDINGESISSSVEISVTD